MAKEILQGDTSKAAQYLGRAKGMLASLKHFMSIGGLQQLENKIKTSDGTEILVKSAFGQDEIHIYANRITSDFFVLITVAPAWKNGQDREGKSIYVPYFYEIKEKDNTINIARINISSSINYSHKGLNLTISSSSDEIAACIATYETRYEEEIGALNRTNGVYDVNLRWGDSIVSFSAETLGEFLHEGSAQSELKPDGKLETAGASRHGYFMEDGKIRGIWLSFGRQSLGIPMELINPTIEYFVNFYGRLEFQNTLRMMYQHRIGFIPIDKNGRQGSWTYTTEYKDVFTNFLDWNYHVPIAIIGRDKALRREVLSEGNPSTYPCYEQTQTEKIYIGDEVIATSTSTTSSTFDIPDIYGNGGVAPPETIGVPGSTIYQMGADDACDKRCPSVPYNWWLTGDAYDKGLARIYAIRFDGKSAVLTTENGACGTITIHIECGGCGEIEHKVRITDGGWLFTGASKSNPGYETYGATPRPECRYGGIPFDAYTSILETISGNTMLSLFRSERAYGCSSGWEGVDCSTGYSWDLLCGVGAGSLDCQPCLTHSWDGTGICPPGFGRSWTANVRASQAIWCCVGGGGYGLCHPITDDHKCGA